MPKLKLTKKIVEELPFEIKGQKVYWDTDLPAFGLIVGKTSKTYVVQRNVRGTNKRVTIGKHTLWVPDSARKKAKELLLKMSEGIDPTEEKRLSKIKGITVLEVFNKFSSERASNLSPKTLRNYQDFLKNHLADWVHKPLREITTDMVIKKHQDITSNAGKYAANHALKFIQTLYNYAMADDEQLINPVKILGRKKLWHPKTRRDTLIADKDLAAWYLAVGRLSNHSIRDSLRLLLFTGLRKTEAFTMQWSNVDFDKRTFLIPHTKNKKPLKLPMSEYVYNLLKERRKNDPDGIWVFPGEGQEGHITEIKKACANIHKDCGVQFMPHDLRRTFITIAETIAPSQYSLKRLLNHTVSGDVTAGYVNPSVETLRKVVEQVSKKIEKLISKKAA